jgi:hypothetical protein
MMEWNDRPVADRELGRNSGRIEVSRSPHGENSASELDRRLDQALEETFPASDPIAILVG